MKHFRLVLACALFIAVGCSSDDAAPSDPDGASPMDDDASDDASMDEWSACTPLVGPIESIEFRELLGAGRAMDGTVYVIEHAPNGSDTRAFESEGATLVRQRVSGRGDGNAGTGTQFYATVESSPEPYTLIVDVDTEPRRMGRTTAPDPRTLAIDDLMPSELLEPVPFDELSDYTLRNLPTPVVIEYIARTPDGSLIVVLYVSWSGLLDYEDFRLFYGPEEQLRERTLKSVERQRDGGSTHLLFDLIGEEADAFFPVMFGDAGFEPAPATLELGGDTIALNRIEEDAEQLSDATFECLD